MDTTCAGVLLSGNITSGGGDGVDTPGASGGNPNRSLVQANIPNYNLTVTITDPGHTHTYGTSNSGAGASPGNAAAGATGVVANNPATSLAFTGLNSSNVVVNSAGSNATFDNMSPFVLGSWYIKL
jgi:hypothetical protein